LGTTAVLPGAISLWPQNSIAALHLNNLGKFKFSYSIIFRSLGAEDFMFTASID
jgi:hypothetical protein